MSKLIENGCIQKIKGKPYIYYDNYWIRYYEPPAESLAAKKVLIDVLTRRTFHHTESGINTPGERLEEVRVLYEAETDPRKKRVKGAMLAGALFNRATDIFTTIVDLEAKGIHIKPDGNLMQQCSQCFLEAMDLSHYVRHPSGEEGVDELWGEPMKVFTMSIKEYYQSRYQKIAMTMCCIDKIANAMQATFCDFPWFNDGSELLKNYVDISKETCAILRSDSDYLELWPEFVSSGEKIIEFQAKIPKQANNALERHIRKGNDLFNYGKDLIGWIANVRVPMNVSKRHYLDACEQYRKHSLKYL